MEKQVWKFKLGGPHENYSGLFIFGVILLFSGVALMWGAKPEPKIYKNGYEVVKIGNCEYLKDVGMFHETLVHDGECKNHGK